MKKITVLCCLLLSTSTMAQVYKCKDGQGKFEYQAVPCTTKSGDALDIQGTAPSTDLEKAIAKRDKLQRDSKFDAAQWDADAPKRKLEKEKFDKAEAEKFDKAEANNFDALKNCLSTGCTASTYRSKLRDMYKTRVEDAVGNCRNQSVGSTNFLYCTVKLEDAGHMRQARLQMEIGTPPNIPDLARPRGERITEINVY